MSQAPNEANCADARLRAPNEANRGRTTPYAERSQSRPDQQKRRTKPIARTQESRRRTKPIAWPAPERTHFGEREDRRQTSFEQRLTEILSLHGRPAGRDSGRDLSSQGDSLRARSGSQGLSAKWLRDLNRELPGLRFPIESGRRPAHLGDAAGRSPRMGPARPSRWEITLPCGGPSTVRDIRPSPGTSPLRALVA
jgi:hypothetical protein